MYKLAKPLDFNNNYVYLNISYLNIKVNKRQTAKCERCGTRGLFIPHKIWQFIRYREIHGFKLRKGKMKKNTLIKYRISSLLSLIATKKPAITFFLIPSVIMLSGCCINRETFFLPEKVKEYVYFKTGSYWIYQDQNGRIDTLRVDNSKISMGRVEENPAMNLNI